MIRIIRWFLGYVKFQFTNGFIDGFVNDCFENGVNVHSLKRNENILYGECSVKVYPRLHKIALKNGGKTRIIKKRGIIFPFLKLRNRWGIFAGALAFVCLVSFLSGFIWNIEITGNEKISTKEISSFLEENGFCRGAYWKNIEKDRLENLIMASFDDCAWVHINEIGTTARVEINETVEKPDKKSKKTITNLKAVKDGIIVKATVYNGWGVARVGDSVVKGDLLVSGIYESENKKTNFFAHASGEYIAEVKEKFSLTVSRKQSRKAYGQEKKYKKINFFGLTIPLYIVPPAKQNCEITESVDYAKLNKKELPIGITTVIARSYMPQTEMLSDKELVKLTEQEIEKKLGEDFGSAEIIKKDIDISLESGEAVAKGTVTCLENIGKEVKIKINKK